MKALPVALAIGDPNGIGPEVAVKAAAALADRALPPILVGDLAVIRTYAERHAGDLSVRVIASAGAAADASVAVSHALNVLPVDALPSGAFRPGTVDAAAGAATVAYVEAALALVQSGVAGSIVACPHSETAVNAAGIPFSGYPSLLARLLELPPDRIFLMLVGGGLRIVHATLHERLRDALDRLTPDLVVAAGAAAAEALVALGVEQQRIGIMAINPHAGENGLFGDDDDRITAPAAERLRAAGLDIVGPQGADVLLAGRDRDVYVAMYHDQGHVPVKLLAPRGSAALSIGGGVVFSSVGHGAAFDIAGQGTADPAATLRAIELVASPITNERSYAR
jgi:4-hydroxythreonine-4-phosphate dehydrogenase